jgi:hypothetical protein
MSILWCGGEDIDFNGVIPPVIATAGRFRAGYARHALNMQNCTLNCYSNAFPGGAVTSCWLHLRGYFGNQNDGADRIIGVTSAGTLKGIYVYQSAVTGNMGKLCVGKYDASSMTNLASEIAYSIGGFQIFQIDLQIINYGGSGTVNLYLNGSLVATYTGDISIAGITELNTVTLGMVGNQMENISEIIVADEDTRSFSLVTHYPNGAGSLLEWTGDYTTIDEATINDADLAYVDVADKDAQYAMSNCPAGTFQVKAVKIAARATKSVDASIGTLKLGLLSGGTVDVDAGQALTTGWATYERLAATINGAAMTTALLDAMELNLRSET